MTLTIEEQELIYESYGVELYQPILSPLRLESNPSFSTKLYGDKVKWIDFRDWKNGDVFNFIMEIEGCAFPAALEKAKKILDGVVVTEAAAERKQQGQQRQQKESKHLAVDTFNFYKKFEIDYWLKRGITEQVLIEEEIWPLRMLTADKVFKTTSTSANPKFVYYLNEDRSAWKIYSPLSSDPKMKWLSFGLDKVWCEKPPQYQNQDLILFAGKKDMLVWRTVEQAYDSTSLLAEGNFGGIIRELDGELKGYKNIYALLDMDNAGEEAMHRMYERSGQRIKPLIIPTNIGNYLAANGVKDIDEIKIRLGTEELNRVWQIIKSENGI